MRHDLTARQNDRADQVIAAEAAGRYRLLASKMH